MEEASETEHTYGSCFPKICSVFFPINSFVVVRFGFSYLRYPLLSSKSVRVKRSGCESRVATPHACREAMPHIDVKQLKICGSRDATGRTSYCYRYNETHTHFSRIHSSQARQWTKEQKWIGKKWKRENNKNAASTHTTNWRKCEPTESSEATRDRRRRRVCSCNAHWQSHPRTQIGIQWFSQKWNFNYNKNYNVFFILSFIALVAQAARRMNIQRALNAPHS